MEVHILDYVIGGVLSIECKDSRQRLVTYLSKPYLSKFLDKTEKIYKIYNKEMLVVIMRFKN